MITEEKIKVFISSKCGGERINFDQLVTTDSKDKKDVAEKAVRTSYDLVRRALRFSLEATGFIKTYVFEDGLASTLSAREDYFDELDTSDICLFLIDNFDEKISDGLLAEITRAQSLNKKSIYLFLNHPNRGKTSVQQNLIGAKGVRYVEIDDLREFIDEGYKSIINDILKIYQMYCRGVLSHTEKAVSSVEITKENFPVETMDVDKQIFKNLGLTKNKIISLVHTPDAKNIHSSDIDKLCLIVVEFLLGEKKFTDIDLESLLEKLKEIQAPELHNIVSKRWKAISDFYNGDLDTAIKTLEALYHEYSEDKAVPKWLINDILIDWRNLSNVDGQVKNVIDFSIQEKINQQSSVLFFPLTDRFGMNISNDILDRNFDLLTSSPYTNHLFNFDGLFDYISNYLFVAMCYGSYTHVVLTLNEIQKVLFDLIQKYDNLLHKIQLMRVSVLYGDEKDFTKIMEKYKSSLSHSTAKEILDLYMLADTKPLSYEKERWKIILFKELGYYFSDTDYETVSNEILGFVSQWIREENFNVSLLEKSIEALKFNKDRLSQVKIIDFANDVFNKKYYRFFDSIFDLLWKLDIPTVPQEYLSRLLSQVKVMLENEEFKQQDLSIEKFLVGVRKSQENFSTEVDKLVEKHFPQFYKQEYHLEIFSGERATHIQRYIDNIDSRNKVQGKGGKFIGYVDNPYMIIKNIIEFDKVSLTEEVLDRLLQTISDTLFSETQTYSEKINSIQLLLYLRITHSYNWEDYYLKLKQNIVNIEKGSSILFGQDSLLSLQLYLVLLQVTFGKGGLQEMLEILAQTTNSDSREIIESLTALNDFLKYELHSLTENPITSVIVQYISAFCFHENDDVRYHTVQVLYQLIDSKYAGFVIGRLAKMMNDNDFGVKIAVVRQAYLIKKHSVETFNYIVAKAKIDNNYLVRKAAEKYNDKQES